MRIVTFTREFSEALKSNQLRQALRDVNSKTIQRIGDELARNFKIALDEIDDSMIVSVYEPSILTKKPYNDPDAYFVLYFYKYRNGIQSVIGATVGKFVVEFPYAYGEREQSKIHGDGKKNVDRGKLSWPTSRTELIKEATEILVVDIQMAKAAKDVMALKKERDQIYGFFKTFGKSIIPFLKTKALKERAKNLDIDKIMNDARKLVDDFSTNASDIMRSMTKKLEAGVWDRYDVQRKNPIVTVLDKLAYINDMHKEMLKDYAVYKKYAEEGKYNWTEEDARDMAFGSQSYRSVDTLIKLVKELKEEIDFWK